MNGMLMMLKSFGLDPEMVTRSAEEIRQAAQMAVEKLDRIEKQNDEIIALLKGNSAKEIENGETNRDATE